MNTVCVSWTHIDDDDDDQEALSTSFGDQASSFQASFETAINASRLDVSSIPRLRCTRDGRGLVLLCVAGVSCYTHRAYYEMKR